MFKLKRNVLNESRQLDERRRLEEKYHLGERRVFGAGASRAFACVFRGLCVLFIVAFAASSAAAQPLDVHIELEAGGAPRAKVEGTTMSGAVVWSFRKSYAGVNGLGERISKFTLADESGAPVGVRALAPGEYEAERPAVRFSYDIALDPPMSASHAAHVSWTNGAHGLLMLGDILPLSTRAARVAFVLPAGWSAATVHEKGAGGRYEVAEAALAVFAVGRGLRTRSARAGSLDLTLASAGEWAFDDGEVLKTSSELLKRYSETAGGAPPRRALLALMPLPRPAPANHWGAETRGSTVSIVSGRVPSRAAALAQLDTALSHELFHLWVPNGLALDGEYEWFYEGFTNYQALREGVRGGRLSFRDYLAAIGRANDAYKRARGARELSLVEAARSRWTTDPSLVYHKGMLVAFLYDMRLSLETRGKRSLADVYRELWRRHGAGAGARADGSRAVVDALKSMPGMSEFTERLVESAARIELASELSAFGLRVEPGGVSTRLGVVEGLNREQRDLLREFGYNEKQEIEARKIREQMRRRLP